MSIRVRRSLWLLAYVLCGGAAAPASLGAQSAAPRPTVLLVDMTFYGVKANSIEPGDSATAQVSTARMRSVLRDADVFVLVDSARAAAAIASADLPGLPCNATLACALTVGQKVGARWVVTGKVSKTSNLIWFLSGQLIDVASGRLVLDDEFELKGARDDMVPRGAASLARRIVRAAARELGTVAEPQ